MDAVRLQPPSLPRVPQGSHQVRQTEVGTRLYVARHNSEPSHAPCTADDVCLDGEVILGFSGALGVPTTLTDRHFAPVRAALVVILVDGGRRGGVVRLASERQGHRSIRLPLAVVLEQRVVEFLRARDIHE